MITNNAEALLKQMLTSGETLGLMAVKDVNGTTRYLADYTAYPNTAAGTFTLPAANAGISVGSGSTTPAKTDYQLAAPITSGLTGTVLAERDTDDNGNAYVTFTVTLTNTSGSDISISEIGYKQELSVTSTESGTTATDHVFLLDRATFTSITLASGESAVLDYRLKSVITNNGGAEGTKAITTNGTYNAIDDDLDGYSSISVNVQPNVGAKNITTNGTYNASSDSYDGYSSVIVNVSPNVGTKNISANGTYNASSDSYDGYSSVTVAVSPNVGSKSITTNGNYYASSDSLDGYSSVAVNVSPNVGTKTITDNGTYNASTESLDGYSSVVVNVSGGGSVLGTKTINQNGTYSAQDDDYDGYSEVTVNVSGGGREDVLATPRMTSDTTPSGVVTASSNYGAYYPYFAFSESCGVDQYTWLSAVDDIVGAWIQYEFPQAETIVKLVTINRGDGRTPRSVKTFIFQGSNDGTTWTDIENCSITSRDGFHREEFLLNNNTAYIYYRLYITSAWETNPRWVGFAQIQMYKECITSSKTITQNGTYNASTDNLGGYSQVVVAVDETISKDIVTYEIITLDTSGTGAAVRVKKYINDVLQSFTDVGYSSAMSEYINFDDYFLLDYGQTVGYNWTYRLLRPSKKRDANATYSWSYGEYINVSEIFADFICNPKTITENGIYYALNDNFDGYSRVNVDVNTGLRQINPFPQGATTLSLYDSNGIVINSSSIGYSGTASMNFTESQAGYEGFVIELNVTAGEIYVVEFDYQNISAEFWENPPYIMGWMLENSARTSYSDYGKWIENIARDALLHHHVGAIVPNGNKIYLNFNVCGYSDSRTNTAEITNLKVSKISNNPSGTKITSSAEETTIYKSNANSMIAIETNIISSIEEVT